MNIQQLANTYKERHGNDCLYCGEEDSVEGHPRFDSEGLWATRDVACLACGKGWTEYFEMEGVILDRKNYVMFGESEAEDGI